jgi:transcriptional regulator with GAF, ATPase, and Fis domain
VRSLLAARRRREQELSALYETAGDLSSLRDLEAVLQAIVRRARQLLDTDAAYLMLHDEPRQLTYMRVTDGIRTDAFKRASCGSARARRPRRGDVRAVRHRRLQRRLAPVDRIDDVVGGEGLVAILGVPLRRRTSVIGVLFAANRRQRPFSPTRRPCSPRSPTTRRSPSRTPRCSPRCRPRSTSCARPTTWCSATASRSSAPPRCTSGCTA